MPFLYGPNELIALQSPLFVAFVGRLQSLDCCFGYLVGNFASVFAIALLAPTCGVCGAFSRWVFVCLLDGEIGSSEETRASSLYCRSRNLKYPSNDFGPCWKRPADSPQVKKNQYES